MIEETENIKKYGAPVAPMGAPAKESRFQIEQRIARINKRRDWLADQMRKLTEAAASASAASRQYGEEYAKLARDLADANRELRSSGPKSVVFAVEREEGQEYEAPDWSALERSAPLDTDIQQAVNNTAISALEKHAAETAAALYPRLSSIRRAIRRSVASQGQGWGEYRELLKTSARRL